MPDETTSRPEHETPMLPDTLPETSDDDTADLPVISTPPQEQAESVDRHEMPTMPLPEESADPRKTLPGSGGFDPNPDFLAPQEQHDAQHTVPHIVPFQHTMVHVPGSDHSAPKPAPSRPTVPNPPQQYTQPNPPRYDTQPQYPPSQQGYPQPPGYANQPPAQGNLPRKRKREQRILGCSPGCLMALVGVFVTFCGGLTLITLLLTATLGARLEEQLQAQVSAVDTYRNFQSTFYYDRNGEELYETFTEGRRTNVDYEDFPNDLINATVAIEDDSFWANPGFEAQATIRAFLQYVGVSEGSTGGSTITQQLVRNVLFEAEYRAERSVQRKVEEILLAVLLSNRKTKQEIMEMYLNEIYYGNLAYGAEAAAQTFFGKRVSDLTLGEAALLAGLPQAPANYDPFSTDPEISALVQLRWQTVLDRMVQEGFITDAQRNEALRQGYTLVQPEVPLRAPHFTLYAQQQLTDVLTQYAGLTPQDIARGGLRVYTTVDLELNEMVQNAARTQIQSLAGNNVNNAAVVVLKPGTGEIMAMVGSVDYNNENIDGEVNVTISARQPGSTMKPFTYAAAMEAGVMTPASIIWDTPTNIAGYEPRNYDYEFHGPMRLRTALANSYNIPAVQTLREVGVPGLLDFMQRLGVNSLGTDASLYGLSLTLGGGEITLLELTRAYTVLANGGSLVPSTAILCVIDNDDNILYEYENGCPGGNETPQTLQRAGFGRQVLDPRIAFVLTDVLADNNTRSTEMGFNSPLNTPGIPTSVKTGTTNDLKDNWTVGYTANVAVGVWVGNTRGEPMVNSTGLTGAAPLWNSVISNIYSNPDFLNQFAMEGQLRADQMPQPQGVSLHRLCNISQLREPAMECASSVDEWMLDGPPGVPDAEGNLQFLPQEPTDNNPPAAGPWLREVEPDIYRVLVQTVPPDIAQQIRFEVPPGEPVPPAPLYCQVPEEARASAAGAREQLFIAPPPVPADAARAEEYSRSSGYAFLPTIVCDQMLINAGPAGPQVIQAFITSPSFGQVVSGGDMPVIGTAQFGPDQALYYKLEIAGAQFGEGNWATIGDVQYSSVVNGQLGTLPVPGLQPGNYQLRLVVVGLDGNFVQDPFTVPFSVQ